MQRAAALSSAASSAAAVSEWTSTAFRWTPLLFSQNKATFGNRSFRPMQREIMNAALSGRDVFVLMPTGGGKCFAAGTRLRLHSGEVREVQSIRAGDELMGDDGCPRYVTPGSLVRGRAPLFRITPALASGAQPFTVNGAHTLVLVNRTQPAVEQEAGSQCWLATWFKRDCSNGMQLQRRRFSTRQAAEEEVRSRLQTWRPLEWEVSVQDFLTASPAAHRACQLTASPAVTFQSPHAGSLEQQLCRILRASPTPAQTAWSCWYLGLWQVQGLSDTDWISESAPPAAKSRHELVARLHEYETLFGEPMTRVEQPLPGASDAEMVAVYQFGSETTGPELSVARRLLAAYSVLACRHIPHAWLCDSLAVRRGLLAGMLDGSNDSLHSVWCENGARQPHIADGIIQLAGSLGIRCRAVSQHDGFRISFISPLRDVLQYSALSCQHCPLLSETEYLQSAERARCFGFSITPLPADDYFGFAVQGGSNRRFLLEDFTVTHNVSSRAAQPGHSRAARGQADSQPLCLSSPFCLPLPVVRLRNQSLTYQLPAIIREGLTVVFSPLLSLIQDQVTALHVADVPAAALTSATSSEEYTRISRDASSGVLKLLYITPEKFKHSASLLRLLRELEQRQRLQSFVIDEAHCFPESDTRVLTDAGLLFLDELEATIAARARLSPPQPLLYACYERAGMAAGGADGGMKGRLVYCEGKLVFPYERSELRPLPPSPPAHLLHFGSAQEARRWAAASGPHETQPLEQDDGVVEGQEEAEEADCHVSLRVTPGHYMFAQTVSDTAGCGGAAAWKSARPPSRIPASSLESAGEGAAMRMLACADAGRTPTASEQAFLLQHVRDDLGLDDAQLPPFLELFGIWLSRGSLSYLSGSERTEHRAAVTFSVVEDDIAFLVARLRACGLTEEQFTEHRFELRRRDGSMKTAARVLVLDPLWAAFFDAEFGIMYSGSRHYDPERAAERQGSGPTVHQSWPLYASSCADLGPGADAASNTGNDSDPECAKYDSQPSESSLPTELQPCICEDSASDVLDEAERPVGSAQWLPRWALLHLRPEQLALILRGLWRADGHRRLTSGARRIVTSSAAFRDQLVHALLSCGGSAHARCLHGAGRTVGYLWRDQSVDSTVHSIAEVRQLLEQARATSADFVPIKSTTATWAVDWMEPRSSSGQAACWPAMRCQDGIRREAYSRERDGRLWCVEVDHADHLIVAQRAERDAAGLVTRQSRPIVTGNCVSQWGHDFRPDYLALDQVKVEFPSTPVIALTATASPVVQESIINVLALRDVVTFRQSFNRANLYYEVRPKRKSCDGLISFIRQHQRSSSGIVYVASIHDCERVCQELRAAGLSAEFYHGRMSNDDRTAAQQRWSGDEVRVMVATMAFGMGINKPDVRFVVHWSFPRSVESFSQETGRAGRDGLPASCVVYYSYQDKLKLEYLIRKEDAGVVKTAAVVRGNMQKLHAMIQFLEDDVSCRRRLMLGMMGEDFPEAECRRGCDNCRNRDVEAVVEEDVTQVAQQLLSIVQQIASSPHPDLCKAQTVLDVYRGANTKLVKERGLNQLEHYGGGRQQRYSATELSRILHELVNRQVLDENSRRLEGRGFSQNIVRLAVGQRGRELSDGSLRMRMQFCKKKRQGHRDEADDDAAAAASTSASSSSGNGSKPQRPTVSKKKAAVQSVVEDSPPKTGPFASAAPTPAFSLPPLQVRPARLPGLSAGHRRTESEKGNDKERERRRQAEHSSSEEVSDVEQPGAAPAERRAKGWRGRRQGGEDEGVEEIVLDPDDEKEEQSRRPSLPMRKRDRKREEAVARQILMDEQQDSGQAEQQEERTAAAADDAVLDDEQREELVLQLTETRAHVSHAAGTADSRLPPALSCADLSPTSVSLPLSAVLRRSPAAPLSAPSLTWWPALRRWRGWRASCP